MSDMNEEDEAEKNGIAKHDHSFSQQNGYNTHLSDDEEEKHSILNGDDTNFPTGTKKHYSRVSYQQRHSLLSFLYENPDKSMKEASENFGIKYSTVKYILKSYQKTGKIEGQKVLKKNQKLR